MTNKSLFHANELICIFIEFFKKRRSSPFMWSLNWIHQQRMHVVKPHFVFSTQIRFWPRCHSYQGISQKRLVIVIPNLHKYLWKYSPSLQYTCYLQKLCIDNMPEKILEQYVNFLTKKCINYANEKYANEQISTFLSFFWKSLLIPFTWYLTLKMGWVVTIGVSKTMLFKYGVITLFVGQLLTSPQDAAMSTWVFRN